MSSDWSLLCSCHWQCGIMILLQLFKFSASFMLPTVMLQLSFYLFFKRFYCFVIFCVFVVVVVADDVVENFQTLHDDTFHCTLHFCVSFSDMDLVVTNTKLQVALTHLGFIRSSSMNLRSFIILWVIVHVSSQVRKFFIPSKEIMGATHKEQRQWTCVKD